MALLNIFSWRHLHVRTTKGKVRGQWQYLTATNVIGWPDLFCWSPRQPGRLLAIELKVPPDTLTHEQRVLLRDLAASGIECYVIRPDDIAVRLPRILDRRSDEARHPIQVLEDQL